MKNIEGAEKSPLTLEQISEIVVDLNTMMNQRPNILLDLDREVNMETHHRIQNRYFKIHTKFKQEKGFCKDVVWKIEEEFDTEGEYFISAQIF